MKKRIAIGFVGLLLTLGTAFAGTLIYGHGQKNALDTYQPASAAQVTPETIAMWKATATSRDYIAPKVPI
jgi:hypothetical protein